MITKKQERVFKAKIRRIYNNDITIAKTSFGKILEDFEVTLRKNKLFNNILADFIFYTKILIEIFNEPKYLITDKEFLILTTCIIYLLLPFNIFPYDFNIVNNMIDLIFIYLAIKHLNKTALKFQKYSQTQLNIKEDHYKNHLIPIRKTKSNIHYIIVSGFMSNPDNIFSYKVWLEEISKIDKNANIYAFYWDTKSWLDYLIRIFFKSSIKFDTFLIGLRDIWSDAILNTERYSFVLSKCIKDLTYTQIYKQKVIVIGHSLGARLVYNAIISSESLDIETFYAVGGAINIKSDWRKCIKGIDQFVNCYSSKDSVLKYAYRLSELFATPIGLKRIRKIDTLKRVEIDCSDFVSGHSMYAKTASTWITFHRNKQR